MKNSLLALLVTLTAGLLAGCGTLDLTPEGNPSRVVSGTVELVGLVALPADAVVVVRVVDPTRATIPQPTTIMGQVTPKETEMSQPPTVLGEQTIHSPGQVPVPYRIEYTATDEQLRRGLNIEARIAFGGRVQYSNQSSFAIVLANVSDPHPVLVNAVR